MALVGNVVAAQCTQLQNTHLSSKRFCSGTVNLSMRQSLNPLRAHPSKEYTMWGDEDADGKDIEFEKDIFEGVVSPKRPHHNPSVISMRDSNRHVVEPISVPRPGLVPEKWRELQYELNRTNRERRRDVMNYKLERTRVVKDRLRERMRVIIDEAIDEEEDKSETAEVRHTVFTDGEKQTTYYGPDDVSEASEVDEEEETPVEENEVDEVDISSGEDEWPPVSRLPQEDCLLPPLDAGRASPVNPRHALKNVTFEELSERMNSPEVTVRGADDHADEDEDVEFTLQEKKLLRRRGSDVDKICCEKWMPLHCLARSGQTVLIAKLLNKEERLRVDNLDRDGFTALFRAVQAGRISTTKQLIKGGANILFRDKHEATLLHHAVASGNPFVVRVLLRYGVDINSVDKWGWTPLHIAVQCQKKELVRSLLSRGADKTIRNKDGNTALDLAFGYPRSYDSDSIIKLIKVQKPDLGVMLRYKGCQRVVAKLASEGLVLETPDQCLVDLSKEARDQLVDMTQEK